MTHLLPAHLLRLFTPRPQLKYVEPADHSLEERRTATISGLAEYMDLLKEDDAGPTEWTESPLERSDRLKDEAREKRRKHLTEDFETDYKPKEDPNVGDYDPFKTLFVYRLSYRCTTKDLEDCFQRFGSLDRVKIPLGKGVDDKKKAHKGRPRGYAFVVFRNESDMREAYRRAQGLVIHGRAIAVDVVRAGTQQGWKPRRYNGGLGGRQAGGPPKPMGGFKPPMGPGRGGFRGGRGGGFRGGFRGDAPSGPRGYGGGGGGYGGRNSNYEPVGQSRGGGGGGGYGGGGGGGRYEDRPRYDDRRRDDRPRYDDRRRDDRPRW